MILEDKEIRISRVVFLSSSGHSLVSVKNMLSDPLSIKMDHQNGGDEMDKSINN